ncbi:MAG: threonylcarbamoyl-AMP synthase [Bacilli bacterium]|nr:threonylcarbamoyl-AMP synthase [Bacilli bacterium]
MKTRVFNKNELNEASELLKNGEIIAFPTETVFGLGVVFNSEKACKNLINVKKRHENKPFTLMCSNLDQIEDVLELNDTAKKIMDAFTPGPITLILKIKKDVPHYLDLGTGYIGIRIPKDETILDLINKVGAPLLVPSANPADMKPARSTKEVLEYFDGEISGVIDGDTSNLEPSTVVKVEKNDIIIIRKGPISLEEIKGVL